MEKGHAEKVHSTYENHIEIIGKKVTVYIKTTMGKIANQLKMGRGLVREWPSGVGLGRANAKHLLFLLLSRKQMTSMKMNCKFCEKKSADSHASMISTSPIF